MPSSRRSSLKHKKWSPTDVEDLAHAWFVTVFNWRWKLSRRGKAEPHVQWPPWYIDFDQAHAYLPLLRFPPRSAWPTHAGAVHRQSDTSKSIEHIWALNPIDPLSKGTAWPIPKWLHFLPTDVLFRKKNTALVTTHFSFSSCLWNIDTTLSVFLTLFLVSSTPLLFLWRQILVL